ncbi:hypothetical protein M5C97_16645 [Acidovorax sp. NCPPB 3859]|nr:MULTISPECIES: hypothetical protein [unclassified Acidovorax]MDA8450647.1 hypothetical protein [Acidovorax sp. GBBC 3297]MDA8459986.1 hypothetical protein [Acidovorax sp. GBBC 3333]MDA8465022.1 hypothetical protein [Acidovorax sp. GBBC 3332]MDA8470162.1 hypothetical protein [Acidovorax sp. GBBC 3299]WCM77137.1 hypothetical protein M5C94_16600 [Acidovorax sp. GBBC 712]
MTPVAEFPPFSNARRSAPALAAVLLCAAGLAGCAVPADLPQPVAHAPSTQKTARAVHHWDVLAADVAERTAVKLREWPSGAHLIYVVPASDGPDVPGFVAGFRTLLITHLVERGLALSTQPSGVRLAVDVQLVQHVAPPGYGARPVLLGDGVRVARDASMENGDYLLAAQPQPVPAATRSTPQGLLRVPARTEILVTTSLESEGRYLARTSDVYFIDQADAALYLPPPPVPLAPPAVGIPATAGVRTWQVVAP